MIKVTEAKEGLEEVMAVVVEAEEGLKATTGSVEEDLDLKWSFTLMEVVDKLKL